jgi:hypothetical protein
MDPPQEETRTLVNSRVRNRMRYYIIPARLNIGELTGENSERLALLALGGLCGFGRRGRVDRGHRCRNPGRLRTQP